METTGNPIIDRATTVYYENPECSSVAVEWTGDDHKNRLHSIPVDTSNSDYKDLIAAGWNEELISKGTEAYKRAAARAFNTAIYGAAKRIAEEVIESRVASKMAQLNTEMTEAYRQSAEAKEKNLEADQKLKAVNVTVDTALWRNIFEQNDNKDEVFKFKLWALELDQVKNADSDSKKELRKQETLFNCITVLNSIINK